MCVLSCAKAKLSTCLSWLAVWMSRATTHVHCTPALGKFVKTLSVGMCTSRSASFLALLQNARIWLQSSVV